MRKEKLYKIEGYHTKGYNAEFDDIIVNEKGLESFKKMMGDQKDATLEEENKWCIGYDLYIKVIDYKVNVVEDFNDMILEWSDEGYDGTWLTLEPV